jgi:hypothetical protein
MEKTELQKDGQLLTTEVTVRTPGVIGNWILIPPLAQRPVDVADRPSVSTLPRSPIALTSDRAEQGGGYMKHSLLMIAVVALVGCGSTPGKPAGPASLGELATPDSEFLLPSEPTSLRGAPKSGVVVNVTTTDITRLGASSDSRSDLGRVKDRESSAHKGKFSFRLETTKVEGDVVSQFIVSDTEGRQPYAHQRNGTKKNGEFKHPLYSGKYTVTRTGSGYWSAQHNERNVSVNARRFLEKVAVAWADQNELFPAKPIRPGHRWTITPDQTWALLEFCSTQIGGAENGAAEGSQFETTLEYVGQIEKNGRKLAVIRLDISGENQKLEARDPRAPERLPVTMTTSIKGEILRDLDSNMNQSIVFRGWFSGHSDVNWPSVNNLKGTMDHWSSFTITAKVNQQ